MQMARVDAPRFILGLIHRHLLVHRIGQHHLQEGWMRNYALSLLAAARGRRTQEEEARNRSSQPSQRSLAHFIDPIFAAHATLPRSLKPLKSVNRDGALREGIHDHTNRAALPLRRGPR